MKVETQRDRIIELTKEQYAAEEQLAENERSARRYSKGLQMTKESETGWQYDQKRFLR